MSKRLFSIGITFIPCYIFWLLLTMSLKPTELIEGAVICLITAWFSSGFFVQNERQGKKLLNPWRWVKLVFYFVFIFMWELIKANCAMAVWVITGKKFHQAIVKIPVNGMEDDYALAVLADCITLTPGTITFDVAEGDENAEHYMYVQWLNLETEDPEKAGEIIKGRMEKWIRRVWR